MGIIWGYLEVILGYLEVLLGYLEVLLGYLEVILGYLEANWKPMWGCLGASEGQFGASGGHLEAS